MCGGTSCSDPHPDRPAAQESTPRRFAAALSDELAALALALETTVDVLALPPPGVTAVLFGDQPIPAQRLSVDDGSVTWEDDIPKISEGMGSVSQATLRALRLADVFARHTGGDVELAEPPSGERQPEPELPPRRINLGKESTQPGEETHAEDHDA